jgi:hypothetical protein
VRELINAVREHHRPAMPVGILTNASTNADDDGVTLKLLADRMVVSQASAGQLLADLGGNKSVARSRFVSCGSSDHATKLTCVDGSADIEKDGGGVVGEGTARPPGPRLQGERLVRARDASAPPFGELRMRLPQKRPLKFKDFQRNGIRVLLSTFRQHAGSER